MLLNDGGALVDVACQHAAAEAHRLHQRKGHPINYDILMHPDETVFITNDLSLFNIANLFFGEDSVQMIEEYNDNYTGYFERIMDDEELAYFYEHPFDNIYNLKTNQYINIYNLDYELIDQLCWKKEAFSLFLHHSDCNIQSQPLFPTVHHPDYTNLHSAYKDQRLHNLPSEYHHS